MIHSTSVVWSDPEYQRRVKTLTDTGNLPHDGEMRSIWKGAITFGLVNVPVKVYSATEDHDLSLHQVHDKDGGRIRYQRRCEICHKIVEYEHIDKAYEEGDRTVVLTDDDLSSLPEEKSREIDVVEFVPSEQLDPIMFDRSYFLEPDSKSSKAYVLLRRTLEETDKTAIVHFALRQKTRLGALRVRGDVLMLQSLLWDDEVREAKFPSLDEKVRISANELEMSAALVESFAADFSPEKFSDDYQDQLRELIEAKLEKGDAVSTEETFGGDSPEADSDNDDSDNVLDLMEALKRSIDASRAKKTSSKSSSTKSSSTPKKTTKKPSTPQKTGSASGSKTKSSGTAKKTGT
jgi:DNA end-binding protein Ku